VKIASTSAGGSDFTFLEAGILIVSILGL
jgi:hypothetical protein